MKKISSIKFNDFRTLLLPRSRDAHKGLFGHALVIGGGKGMPGAVRLSAEAALRVGAGLVSVATQPENINAIVTERPEIMAHGVKKAKDLKPLLAKASIIVAGIGLGQTSWSKQLMTEVFCAQQSKVIDADALNLLASRPKKCENWILTPHPGEAARLLNSQINIIQGDRIKAVKQLQQMYGGVIVLKGAGSLICTSNSLRICKAGNPGMASGGMGDVLSGVIGGLLAQQFDLRQAAELGVYIHAVAGDLVAKQQGERGMLASDLIPYLTKIINLSSLAIDCEIE